MGNNLFIWYHVTSSKNRCIDPFIIVLQRESVPVSTCLYCEFMVLLVSVENKFCLSGKLYQASSAHNRY